jgi:hypothetical protein
MFGSLLVNVAGTGAGAGRDRLATGPALAWDRAAAAKGLGRLAMVRLDGASDAALI